MKEILTFSLLGLGEGSLIAGVAIALVLFYRGAGVINLATGAIAMITGYSYWATTTGQFGFTLGTGPALVVSFLVAIAQGLIMEFGAFRPLRTAPPLAKLISTLGFFLFAQAAVLLAFGPDDKSEPAILPQGSITIFGAPVGYDQLILAGIVVLVAAALTAVYRWTGFGIRTRASAENEVSAMYVGLFPQTSSLINTLLGAVIAGMLGVLAAPLVTLNSTTFPLLVVPALAAALFARFTSFGIACAVGLALGALQNVIYYLSTLSWFPTSNGTAIGGVNDLVVFLLIVLATFWMGGKLPGRGDLVEQRLPDVPKARNIGRYALIALGVGVVALIVFPYGLRQALMTSMIGAVLALSLVVITGFVGQVSVVQLALSGGCGFVMSSLMTKAGIGFPFAPIIAVIFTTFLGVVIAVGALRVRGVQLAVVTLAAAVAMTSFWFINPDIGAGLGGAPIDQPALFGFDLGNAAPFRGLDGERPSPILGFSILVLTILACLFVANLRRSGLGQRMLAVRSNERAAAAAGINVARVKIAAFGMSSFIAGVAGAMYAYNFGSVSAIRFSAIAAFTVIAFAYVGGITMVTGALIAGVYATSGIGDYITQQWIGISGVWLLLFGGWAVLSTVVFMPEGIAGGMRKKRLEKQRQRDLAAADSGSPVAATAGGAPAAAVAAGTLNEERVER
jgi:ABC-type branched-subunit amino acid transport system permease subunit